MNDFAGLREDGSTLIQSGTNGLMITPAKDGVIIVVGRVDGSPFDTRPWLLPWAGVEALREALVAAQGDFFGVAA